MRVLNISILQALVAIGSGIIVYDYFRIDLAPLYICIFILLAILITLHWVASKKIFSEIPFALLLTVQFVALGYLTRERANALLHSDHYSHISDDRDHVILFSIHDQLKPTAYQQKYVAQIHSIDNKKSSGLLLLNISKDSVSSYPQTGEWYYTNVSILNLPEPKNPYQFDYGKYLERKRIYGQLSLDRNELLRSENVSSGLRVLSSRFRESVQNSLRSHPFSSSQLAIIEALVLGQKQGIDKEMSAQYAAAGMMHILAVSGLHVGIVLLLLRLLFSPMNWYHLRWVKSGIIIFLIWAFAFITGLSPSVMRAATMFTFLEIGSRMGGKRKSRDAVLVSALLLLLYDPMLLYQVGFQLSYLAVLAILWIQPWLEGFWKPKFWALRYLWGIATVTVAAQIGVMPLSLFYFHQFPGLFFISNILILPFLGVILSGGILIAGLSMAHLLPEWLVYIYGGIINTMNGLIAWVASQESFVSRHISVSLGILLLSYAVLVTCISLLKKFTTLRLTLASLAVVLITGLIIYEKTHPTSSHLAILNKSKATHIVAYHSNRLKVYHNDSLFSIENDYRINSYRDALPVKEIREDSMRNYFQFHKQELLVIDSLGIYGLKDAQPAFILLTQSPRVNLERIIANFPDATIIADASNYRSYVDRWRATCKKKKIPFHSTYEKGAYILK